MCSSASCADEFSEPYRTAKAAKQTANVIWSLDSVRGGIDYIYGGGKQKSSEEVEKSNEHSRLRGDFNSAKSSVKSRLSVPESRLSSKVEVDFTNPSPQSRSVHQRRRSEHVSCVSFRNFIKIINKMAFILRRSPYVLALFPMKFFSDNKDTPDPKTVEKYVKSKDLPTETGKDRLRRMFSKDEYGDLSPEIRYCIHMSSMALILGALYGGVIRGRTAFINFIDSNEATMFRNHRDAKRQLQDQVSLSVFKGAIEWGWRTCFFSTAYALTSTIIPVFRGKSGVIEHVDGGLIAGAIYNAKNGVRGMIVGGGLGGALGAIFGSIFYGFLLVTGRTVEEVRFWTYEWNKHREDLYTEHSRKYRLDQDEQKIVKLTEKLTEPELALHATKKESVVE